MSATIHPITLHPRFKQEREPEMSKMQLSLVIGRSTRWIEDKQRDEGLPFRRLKNGYCRYLLSEVEPWIASRTEGRTP